MSVSDPLAFKFDLNDLHNLSDYPLLTAFLQQHVRELHVEFLQQGSPKPHVLLRLVTSGSVSTRSRDGHITRIMGCLISMEYIGGQQDTGSFLIKLIHYDDSSFAAGAGFRFPLLQTLKVSHFIRIFQGMDGRLPVEHQSDLTHYNFVVADYATMSVDGCRDIVTQWMIRLHTMGVVGWVADAQTVPGIVFDWTLNSWAFQDLIGNNYKFSGRSDGDRQRIVNITYLPLDRGVFPDPRVRRIETYGRVRLPYNPPAY